jgi:hypothetical protein
MDIGAGFGPTGLDCTALNYHHAGVFPMIGQGGRRKRRGFTVGLESLEVREVLSTVISGFVFNDTNHNGLFETNEGPLAGSTIVLKNDLGTVIGTTTAAANGSYSFNVDQSISPAPATQTQTIFFQDSLLPYSKTGNIAKFNPALGTLTSVDIINTGAVTDTVLVENRDTSPHTLTASVTGSVTVSGPGVASLTVSTNDMLTFPASAFDGILDFAGTSGKNFGKRVQSNTATTTLTSAVDLAGYTGAGTVTFTDSASSSSSVTGSGNVTQSIATTASGSIMVVYHYTPSQMIMPGKYTVVQKTEPAGFTNGLNSANGVVLTSLFGANTIPIQVVAGTSNYPRNDFGENQFPSILKGSVFFDANNNGVRDANEFGIAHVNVILTGQTILGQPVSQVATTDTFGFYQFTGLSTGNYTLTEVHPNVFLKGKDHLGTLGGVKTVGKFSNIFVPIAATGVSYDFGELAKPGCKLLDLILHHTQPGKKVNPNQVGPDIRFYVPSLVPLVTSSSLASPVAAPMYALTVASGPGKKK